ncbi:MAG: uracil-DNA glycosylase [Oscillospiraceae bacterium]|nr:uracil-DNA glycosylase [Oscillospiraceae bacterium]
MDKMDALREKCLSCRSCPLAATRTKVVFGVGPAPSDIVFVGEGPGQQEDLTGEPFVGAAGRLLDDMLSIIDLGRQNCYICNIVKCRPPQNRDPMPEEQDACIGFLQEQLALLQPKIVVCLGRIAAMRLIREDFRITREHGQWTQKDGIWYSALYHPSALLRDVSKRPETFADLLSLRSKAREVGCIEYKTE